MLKTIFISIFLFLLTSCTFVNYSIIEQSIFQKIKMRE